MSLQGKSIGIIIGITMVVVTMGVVLAFFLRGMAKEKS